MSKKSSSSSSREPKLDLEKISREVFAHLENVGNPALAPSSSSGGGHGTSASSGGGGSSGSGSSGAPIPIKTVSHLHTALCDLGMHWGDYELFKKLAKQNNYEDGTSLTLLLVMRLVEAYIQLQNRMHQTYSTKGGMTGGLGSRPGSSRPSSSSTKPPLSRPGSSRLRSAGRNRLSLGSAGGGRRSGSSAPASTMMNLINSFEALGGIYDPRAPGRGSIPVKNVLSAVQDYQLAADVELLLLSEDLSPHIERSPDDITPPAPAPALAKSSNPGGYNNNDLLAMSSLGGSVLEKSTTSPPEKRRLSLTAARTSLRNSTLTFTGFKILFSALEEPDEELLAQQAAEEEARKKAEEDKEAARVQEMTAAIQEMKLDDHAGMDKKRRGESDDDSDQGSDDSGEASEEERERMRQKLEDEMEAYESELMERRAREKMVNSRYMSMYQQPGGHNPAKLGGTSTSNHSELFGIEIEDGEGKASSQVRRRKQAERNLTLIQRFYEKEKRGQQKKEEFLKEGESHTIHLSKEELRVVIAHYSNDHGGIPLDHNDHVGTLYGSPLPQTKRRKNNKNSSNQQQQRQKAPLPKTGWNGQSLTESLHTPLSPKRQKAAAGEVAENIPALTSTNVKANHHSIVLGKSATYTSVHSSLLGLGGHSESSAVASLNGDNGGDISPAPPGSLVLSFLVGSSAAHRKRNAYPAAIDSMGESPLPSVSLTPTRDSSSRKPEGERSRAQSTPLFDSRDSSILKSNGNSSVAKWTQGGTSRFQLPKIAGSSPLCDASHKKKRNSIEGNHPRPSPAKALF